ncbi:ABC-type sugar transport system, periplasmic component [Sphaerochaeta pleomorpha str. Grapes]|uniref:ABC-type sugar transport system, periplasmic component n=1 Tax=Sphaerochaeta pleomorpha (strain ATCC BAA-1885 / DSM 22778 / Grapes) TaxID=158190 RepID=G8QTD1_SPHPG|nr:ABC transporter substrate-binding protein [Sphaerochaeta pleomorpha]AEV29098.1 ABC-type sugar transport system, periplasmic component [Sphaerochaeta pleomorpha str. Grapes]
MKKNLLLLALVAILASCSLFAQGQKEPVQSIKTITWWHSNSGLLQTAAEKMVQEFNTTVGKEKGIVVEAVYQGKSNDVLTKTKALLQKDSHGSLPDLVQLDASGVLDVRDSEYLIDMEDLAKADSYDLNQILSACRLSVTYKGKMIAMPFNSSTILLYYNKTAFDEAGISSAPKTLDELAVVAQKLVVHDAKGKVTRYGIANVPTTYELCVWLGQQNGLSYITDEQNGHTGTPSKVVFDENGTMETFLKKWKALYQTGALENLTSDVNSEFASGKVAMMAASTSKLTTVMQMVGDRFELGVASLPMVNEQATGGVNVGGGAIYAFDNGAGNSEAAWEFVKFATSGEQQLAWHIATGYFPVNAKTYSEEAFLTYNKENPLFGVAIKQLQDSNPLVQGVWVPSAYQIYYAFQSGILKMLTEDKGERETTEAIAKEINGYLSDYARANP